MILTESDVCRNHILYIVICWGYELMIKFKHFRVMTVSFHKYGDKFFPGTGDMKVHFIAAFLFFFAKFHILWSNFQGAIAF